MKIRPVTPEQLAKQHVNKDVSFSPYVTGSTEHVRYADEILRLTTKAGEKR